MLKICHCTTVHSRYDDRIFYKECVSLANAEYDVTLLVADNKADEVKNGVNIKSIDFHPKDRLDRMLRVRRVMLNKALEENARVYHLHDPELLTIALGLKKRGKKVIFDSHENYPEQIKQKDYIPSPLRVFVSKIYKCYETYVCRKLDAVVIPCTFFCGKNIFQNRAKQTVFIQNTPILAEFYDKYYTVKNESSAVCYAGGLTRDRGITNAVLAAYNAGVALLLAGEFSPFQYGEELKKREEFSCVDYRGHLSREGVLKMYRESSIGLATLLNVGQYQLGDNLATKVYEYMSMGLPVIINKYPYSEKVLSKYKCGIAVDPDNVEEIAGAIRYLAGRPEEAKQMGENGRRAVREEFNWGAEEKKLLRLYESLTASV